MGFIMNRLLPLLVTVMAASPGYAAIDHQTLLWDVLPATSVIHLAAHPARDSSAKAMVQSVRSESDRLIAQGPGGPHHGPGGPGGGPGWGPGGPGGGPGWGPGGGPGWGPGYAPGPGHGPGPGYGPPPPPPPSHPDPGPAGIIPHLLPLLLGPPRH